MGVGERFLPPGGRTVRHELLSTSNGSTAALLFVCYTESGSRPIWTGCRNRTLERRPFVTGRKKM